MVLSAGLFFLSIDRVSAASPSSITLEVKYPTISNKTITASSSLPSYVSYLFNAGIFIGFFIVFLSLTAAGVMYFLSPAKPDMLSEAKDRIFGSVSGMLILVLTYLIIYTINPRLIGLTTNTLPSVSEPTSAATSQPRNPGVYLYKKSDCSDSDAQPYASNYSDLGILKKKINGVEMQNDDVAGTSYISILYSNPDLWGECKYIDPTSSSCQSATDQNGKPFASSLSVYEFDSNSANDNPSDGGVYFFRKPCLNSQDDGSSDDLSKVGDLITYCKDVNSDGSVTSYDGRGGGWKEISNSDITPSGGSMYVKKLDDLKFDGDGGGCNVPVPQDQYCQGYTAYGICVQAKWTCPTLGGGDVSSIIINGNYLVLLFYYGPSDSSSGPWTACQEFPKYSDINKIGPQTIKWENIRNTSGVADDINGKIVNTGGIIPNYMVIMPIKGGGNITCTDDFGCPTGQTCGSDGICTSQ